MALRTQTFRSVLFGAIRLGPRSSPRGREAGWRSWWRYFRDFDPTLALHPQRARVQSRLRRHRARHGQATRRACRATEGCTARSGGYRHVNETSTPPSDQGVWDRLRRRKVVQWSSRTSRPRGLYFRACNSYRLPTTGRAPHCASSRSDSRWAFRSLRRWRGTTATVVTAHQRDRTHHRCFAVAARWRHRLVFPARRRDVGRGLSRSTEL